MLVILNLGLVGKNMFQLGIDSGKWQLLMALVKHHMLSVTYLFKYIY